MTTLRGKSVKCGCCGQASRQTYISSTNTLRMPDLDLRPSEMERSTMPYWVEQCPHCGYCAPDIGDCDCSLQKAVHSAPYCAILEQEAAPVLARRFEAAAYLCGLQGNPKVQARCLHHAAWAYDDAEMEEKAVQYRQQCIEALLQCRAADLEVGEPGALEAVLADLFRRTGRLEEARAECQRGLPLASDEGIPARLFQLQLELIAQGDRGCHVFPETPATPEQLRRQEEARREAEVERKRLVEVAMRNAQDVQALYERIRKTGGTCSHCGHKGVAETDFKLIRSPRPRVVCRNCGRKCGWPQDVDR